MAYAMVKPPDAGGKKKKETPAEKTRQQTKTASAGGSLSATGKKQIQSYIESFNARHGKNTALALYDLDAGQKEIDTLRDAIRKLEQEKFLASYGAMRGTYLAPPVSSFDAAANNAALAALQEELSGKTRAYNLAKRYQQSVFYEDSMKNEDFDRFDDYKPSDDVLYNWINDPSYRESYEALYGSTFQTAFQDSPYTGRKESPFQRSGYDRMNESEIAIYNYYYAKEGKKAAEKYLDSIQETLNARTAEDLYGMLAGDAGLEMLFGAAAGVDGFESGVRSAFNFGDDYIPPTAHQIASSKVREDLEDVGFKLPDWLGGASVGQVAYDAITTAANAAPSLLVSYATGIPMAGNVLSGISTAGNAYNQALNEGFAKDQARGYGLLVGTSEVVLNKLLGGISAYGGNKLGNKALQNLTNVGKTLKMVAKTLGGGLSEIPEGHLQAALETMLRNIVLKTDEKVDFLSPEMLYSDLLSALTGIGVESVDAAVNGLSAESTAMDSSTKDSDYAEFADILNEPEDLENFKYLASLPKAEQEAFIESLTVDALEEGKPATALEDSDYAEFEEIFDGLEGLDYLESLKGEELENFISSLTVETLEGDSLDVTDEIVNPETEISIIDADLPLENHEENGILSVEASALPDRFKEYVPELKRRREIIAEGIELERPIFDNGLLGSLAKGLPPYEDYYDVVLHGSKYGFEYFGEPIDVETLCAIIAQRKDYKKGTKIRLIACYSGAAVDGVARYMANKLHVIVLAPDNQAIINRSVTGKTIVYSGSKTGVRDGEFIPFIPDEVKKK